MGVMPCKSLRIACFSASPPFPAVAGLIPFSGPVTHSERPSPVGFHISVVQVESLSALDFRAATGRRVAVLSSSDRFRASGVQIDPRLIPVKYETRRHERCQLWKGGTGDGPGSRPEPATEEVLGSWAARTMALGTGRCVGHAGVSSARGVDDGSGMADRE